MSHALLYLMADISIESPQNKIFANDLRHFTAQPTHNTGKFHANVTSTNNGDMLWLFGQVKHFVRGNGMFHTW